MPVSLKSVFLLQQSIAWNNFLFALFSAEVASLSLIFAACTSSCLRVTPSLRCWLAPTPMGSFYRTAATQRERNRDGADAASASDESGTRNWCATQKHGGADDRHCQIGNGIPSILVTRIRKRQRLDEAGGDGVEFEANVYVGGVAEREMAIPLPRSKRSKRDWMKIWISIWWSDGQF